MSVTIEENIFSTKGTGGVNDGNRNKIKVLKHNFFCKQDKACITCITSCVARLSTFD